MILVDTSVWADHFRRKNSRLIRHLETGDVLCHESVIGELACGNLKNRREILALLQDLPQAAMARNEEVLAMIGSRRLFGRGIGWIDAHLLAAARLTQAGLWTLDKRLESLALEIGVSGSI